MNNKKDVSGYQIADAQLRFLALCLDYLFIVLLFMIMYGVLGITIAISNLLGVSIVTNNKGVVVAALLTLYIFFIAYHHSQIFKESGRDIGERLSKIKMIPLATRRISFKVAFFRLMFVLVPLLSLFSIYYYAYIDGKRSYLDRLCDTITLRE